MDYDVWERYVTPRKPLSKKFWEKVDKSDPEGCWLWTGAKTLAGYGTLVVWEIDGVARQARAHRLSWEIEQGWEEGEQPTLPDGACVCHRCDTPACVRPDHLFLGDNADNTADMVQKGRQARGDRNCGKLSDEQVVQVRGLHAKGRSSRSLAREFGLSSTGMDRVVKRQTYAYIA